MYVCLNDYVRRERKKCAPYACPSFPSFLTPSLPPFPRTYIVSARPKVLPQLVDNAMHLIRAPNVLAHGHAFFQGHHLPSRHHGSLGHVEEDAVLGECVLDTSNLCLG